MFFSVGGRSVGECIREQGFTAVMGEDGSKQPGDLKDLMVHETAVAWLTHRLHVTTPVQCWCETAEDFGARLRAATAFIKAHHNVEALYEGPSCALGGAA